MTTRKSVLQGLAGVALAASGLALVAAPGLRAAPEAMKIGTRPENFTLTCPAGKQHQLFSRGEQPAATVVLFVATQCPVSLAYDARMAALAKEFGPRGVRFLGVNSNKQEPMAEVGEHAQKAGLGFVVVKDPENKIADKWGALVTPEAFVFDARGTLAYHGRIDDSQNPANVKSHDLRKALEALLAGKRPDPAETRAFGCTIKRI